MSRNYRYFLEDIAENASFVLRYTGRRSFEKFVNDTKTVTATIKHLENIGEAARQLPDSVKERYPDIKWREMVALRNVLAHQYFGINHKLIWAIVREEIPVLHKRIRQILVVEPLVISQ